MAMECANLLTPKDQAKLDALYEQIKKESRMVAGYPCPANFDYSPIFPFLYFPINNVGDPFVPSTYRVHTRDIECEVLAWFAELTHIPPNEYWGYVTNGGTEGNIYGLFLARELFPNGLVYYSEAAHYSVPKTLRVLNMKHIMIKSQQNGETDYQDLYETIRIHRDVPPIIFANIGTTMTEAADDVIRIRTLLQELAIPESYIHCDAALSGMVLPFADSAPTYDFRAGIDSISISGHKFIGSPIPCGVVLAKRRYVDRIARSIEYVGTLDTTLSGSRNGITPLFLWYAIRTIGLDGFRGEVARCVANAQHAVEKLKQIGIHAWRNPFAITVVFPRPPRSVVEKWQIATDHEQAHIVVSPSVTKQQLDELIEDIAVAQEGHIQDGAKASAKTRGTKG
jgi:histidine decarboxylase